MVRRRLTQSKRETSSSKEIHTPRGKSAWGFWKRESRIVQEKKRRLKFSGGCGKSIGGHGKNLPEPLVKGKEMCANPHAFLFLKSKEKSKNLVEKKQQKTWN